MNTDTDAYESLRTSDTRFAYHRAGHGGVPIVPLHGWLQTSSAWRRLLEEFASSVSGGSVADRAHWLLEERPDLTTHAILKFLADRPRQA